MRIVPVRLLVLLLLPCHCALAAESAWQRSFEVEIPGVRSRPSASFPMRASGTRAGPRRATPSRETARGACRASSVGTVALSSSVRSR